MTNDTSILALIPQRPPFVMVDSFVYVDEQYQYSLLKAREDNLFVENGVLTEAGLVENIAQTAAARIGYLCRLEGKPVPVGYIGAVQNLEINSLPIIDDEIKTEISVTNQVFNVTLITGRCFTSTRGQEILLVQCDMKIFISNQ